MAKREEALRQRLESPPGALTREIKEITDPYDQELERLKAEN
jgi:hypothetical protein